MSDRERLLAQIKRNIKNRQKALFDGEMDWAKFLKGQIRQLRKFYNQMVSEGKHNYDDC